MKSVPCLMPAVLENHKTDIQALRQAFTDAQRNLMRVNRSVQKTLKTLAKESKKERLSTDEEVNLRGGSKTLNDKTATQTVVELLASGEKSLDELVTGFLNRKQVFTNSRGLKSTVEAAVGQLFASKVVKRTGVGVYALRRTVSK